MTGTATQSAGTAPGRAPGRAPDRAPDRAPGPGPGAPALTRCVGRLLDAGTLTAGGPDVTGPDALAGRAVAVMGDDVRERAAVARGLRRHGCEVREVTASDDAGVATQVAGVDTLVDLGVAAGAPVVPGAWRAALRRTYAALGSVAPAWRDEDGVGRNAYVAVTRFGGHLGARPDLVEQPLGGLWAGLAKTLPRELPAVTVRVVDVAPGVDAAGAVAAELTAGRFGEVGVGADGARRVLVPDPVGPGGSDRSAVPGVGPDSVVVMVGGARGIGYEVARHLRAEIGCRVVVSGRTDFGAVDPELLAMDDAAAAAHAREQLRRAGAAGVRAARAENARLGRAREAWRNLRASAAAGHPLEYVTCDVTRPADVAALVAAGGDRVAAVVHDAGIDTPALLGAKSPEAVAAVVSVKVDGFLHVLDAARAVPQAQVCAIGSLTGRFGGTRGQSDYAAANEALARLAEHAAGGRPGPVCCLSWPTWDDVGLITNFAAAVHEMAPVPIDVGARAWAAEMVAGTRGEVLMMAPVGTVGPLQAWSLPVPSTYPGAAALVGSRVLLGRPRRWAPSRVLVTAHEPGLLAPARRGLTVAGRPALPPSVAAELLLAAAGWLTPLGAGPVVPAGLRGWRYDPQAACCAGELVRRAELVRDGDGWVLDVELIGEGGDGVPRTVSSARIPLRERHAAPRAAPVPPACALAPVAPAARAAAATGEFVWHCAPGAIAIDTTPSGAQVWAEPRTGADLYLGHVLPDPVLPSGVLEALLRAACPSGATAGLTLRVDTADIGPGDAATARDGVLAGCDAVATDPSGRAAVILRGLRWTREGP